jgi:hypothetical protein
VPRATSSNCAEGSERREDKKQSHHLHIFVPRLSHTHSRAGCWGALRMRVGGWVVMTIRREKNEKQRTKPCLEGVYLRLQDSSQLFAATRVDGFDVVSLPPSQREEQIKRDGQAHAEDGNVDQQLRPSPPHEFRQRKRRSLLPLPPPVVGWWPILTHDVHDGRRHPSSLLWRAHPLFFTFFFFNGRAQEGNPYVRR